MSWRLAHSLQTLRRQIDAAWPNRSKASDGSIGNEAHRQRTSDHNPDSLGRVCAIDITHDPISGADMHRLAGRLTLDLRVKYLIWDRRSWSPSNGWRTYAGPNLHTKHLHVSVTQADADDARQWNLTFSEPVPEDPPAPVPPREIGEGMVNLDGTSPQLDDQGTGEWFDAESHQRRIPKDRIFGLLVNPSTSPQRRVPQVAAQRDGDGVRFVCVGGPPGGTVDFSVVVPDGT